MKALNYIFLFNSLVLVSIESLEFEYHNNDELETFLKSFVVNTTNIQSELYQIGVSSKTNTPLLVVKLNSFNQDESGIPNVKFVANIHGNEAVGRELLLHFMEFLRDNYEKNERVKCLLDNAIIHFLPSMNPDGFSKATRGMCKGELGRTNGHNLDLNRNFPDFYRGYNVHPESETEAVMKWMNKTRFVLSAGLHGGAMVANYPFDTERTKKSFSPRSPSLTPDNDVFKHLADVYARNHRFMKENRCENGVLQDLQFENGTTNGAAWYSFHGGMQDYNYFAKGCMELTLEISCCKYPRSKELEALWEQNRDALLMYSLESLKGVKGVVLNSDNNQPIPNAILQIDGRNITFGVTEKGEFWRILLPGTYNITAYAEDFYHRSVQFNVTDNESKCPKPKKLVILLTNTSFYTTEETVSSTKKFGTRQAKLERNQDSGRILNPISNTASPFPLTREEEQEVYLMIFGTSDNPKGFNTTEDDIRKFIGNSSDEISNFNKILKNFNNQTDEEKTKTMTNVVISLITEEYLREYMKKYLSIEDFSSYSKLLSGFDKKNVEEKKRILLKLKNIFLKFDEDDSSSSRNNIINNHIISALLIILILGDK